MNLHEVSFRCTWIARWIDAPRFAFKARLRTALPRTRLFVFFPSIRLPESSWLEPPFVALAATDRPLQQNGFGRFADRFRSSALNARGARWKAAASASNVKQKIFKLASWLKMQTSKA